MIPVLQRSQMKVCKHTCIDIAIFNHMFSSIFVVDATFNFTFILFMLCVDIVMC